MKKVFYAFSLVFASIVFSSFSTDNNCEMYFPTKAGATFEITDYDKKGKKTSLVKHKVISNNGTEIKAQASIYAKLKDKEPSTEMDYSVKCDGDDFHFNIGSMTMGGNAAMQGMEMDMEGGYITIPTNPSVGQKLKGGDLTVNIGGGASMPMAMKFVTTISNRKVEAIENVTTPAGTFKCVKISEDVEVKSIMKIKSKSVTWYAKGVGMVRSETYNRKGKLMGHSELTKISK